MRMVGFALVACAGLAFATTLPAAHNSIAPSTTTPAEARLIDRLRDMAQPADAIAELPRRPRAEVAMTNAATPAPQSEAEKLTVLPVELNIRSGPDRNATVLGRLAHGDTIEVAERRDGWVRVLGEGVNGWASARFLSAAH